MQEPVTPHKQPSPEKSPFVEAFRMISHIITAVSLMLLCGGLGYLIDRWLGVNGVTLAGFAGGGYLGIKHLIQVTSQSS